jgi:hypothetical protein
MGLNQLRHSRKQIYNTRKLNGPFLHIAEREQGESQNFLEKHKCNLEQGTQ